MGGRSTAHSQNLRDSSAAIKRKVKKEIKVKVKLKNTDKEKGEKKKRTKVCKSELGG